MKKAQERLAEIVKRYPDKKCAVMPALHIIQSERGWIDNEALGWVATELGLPPAHVREVFSFYTMYYKQPVGRYHIQLCRTLSCMLCGAQKLGEHIAARLGVKAHEITADGMWSFEEVECLGSCGTAPMVQINDIYFENLTTEKLDAIMNQIEKEKPDLRYTELTGKLGAGMKGNPPSRVWESNLAKS